MRYTLKIILNKEIVRCSSYDKEHAEREFNVYANLTYKEIFALYGENSLQGKLEIQLYKKNKHGGISKSSSKKCLKNIVYDLDSMIVSEKVVFETAYLSGTYTYIETDNIPRDIVMFSANNIIYIHPITMKKFKYMFPDGYSSIKHITLKV